MIDKATIERLLASRIEGTLGNLQHRSFTPDFTGVGTGDITAPAGMAATLGKGPGMGAALGLGASVAGMLPVERSDGRQRIGMSALRGGLQGASMGAQFGPVGAGIGAVAGAAVSAITASSANRKMDNLEKGTQFYESIGKAQTGQDSKLSQGTGMTYYRMGGRLGNGQLSTQLRVQGGKLVPLSRHSLDVQGDSHEQGGVDIGNDNEVEGGETISQGYVFSDKLGFAEAHRRLMKQMGKIEQKPPTPERMNSIRGILAQTKELEIKQELFRNALNTVRDAERTV